MIFHKHYLQKYVHKCLFGDLSFWQEVYIEVYREYRRLYEMHAIRINTVVLVDGSLHLFV
jgi:hypothetical protein